MLVAVVQGDRLERQMLAFNKDKSHRINGSGTYIKCGIYQSVKSDDTYFAFAYSVIYRGLVH